MIVRGIARWGLTIAVITICLALGPSVHAGFPDVEGTRYERPVEVLGRLGLITGFSDGTFRPHAHVTRAEFAALAVRARGLETASKFVAGATPYPDVPAQHWASGHVNIATDYQLIRGYPDGTFRPAESVSYAEALAIIVRLVGCDQFVSGRWPENYLAAAAALGITTEPPPSNRPATRADVALFIERALTVPTGQSPWLTAPAGESTLLDLNPAVTSQTGVVSDVWVRPESPLSEAHLSLFSGGRDRNLRLADPRVNLADLLGREVRVWSQAGEVLAFTCLTPDSATVSGDIIQVELTDGVVEWITVPAGRYPVHPGAVMFRNYRRLSNANQRADQWLSGTVRIVCDAGGAVIWMEAVTFEGTWVVGERDSRRRTLEVTDSSGVVRTVRFGDYQTVTCFANGQAVNPFTLPRGTVIHYFAAGQERLHLEVRSQVRELFCEAVFAHASTPVIRLGGWDYPVAGSTLSLDGSFTVEPVSAASLARLLHRSVRAHIDPSGRIRHLSADIIAPLGDRWTGVLVTGPGQHSPTGTTVLTVVTDDGRYVRVPLAAHAAVRDSAGNQVQLSPGTLVQVSRREDTGPADLVEELNEGPAFELLDSLPGIADRLLWTGARWTRLSPGGAVFSRAAATPYALHPAALRQLIGAGGLARAVRSTDASISALVVDEFGPVAEEAGIVLSPARDWLLWVLTARGPVSVSLDRPVQVLSGRNGGAQSAAVEHLQPGDFVIIDDNAIMEPAAWPSDTTGIWSFAGVDENGVLKLESGGQARYLLTDWATVVVDPSGVGGRADLTDISPGAGIQVFDLDRDGLVDFLVIVRR